MKKMMIPALALLVSVSFFSCKGGEKKDSTADSTSVSDSVPTMDSTTATKTDSTKSEMDTTGGRNTQSPRGGK